MWVAAARQAVLSVISGGGKWVEITANADPLYQHLIVTAERKFWRCVERPGSCRGEPPKPRIEAVRIVDMSASNAWADFGSDVESGQAVSPSWANRLLSSRGSGCPGGTLYRPPLD